MVVSVIFATFENITKSLQHGFFAFFATLGFFPMSLQHFALQHFDFSQKPCNIFLQQNCCRKSRFATIKIVVKKKAIVAKKKTYGRRSIAGIKESFKGNAARARLARGF